MNNGQSYTETASATTSVTYVKNLTRKRGRSANRREKRLGCTESRIIRDKLAAAFANKEYRKEMNQFEKTVKEASGRGITDIPMPDFLLELRNSAKLHEGNLASARVTHEVMNKYPPLSRHA